ncbi:MAG: hypothetical protein LBP59_17815 [Planctomycetaceae bacterium]|jgi:DNA-directed RNA polymerase subunit M/transcription elongation factor TFIIS|nr:hypothetical protein [Planctomycetaceae bacterium]
MTENNSSKITVACSHCGTQFAAARKLIGQQKSCPTCNKIFIVQEKKQPKIVVSCPYCHSQFAAAHQLIGQKKTCPTCKKIFIVKKYDNNNIDANIDSFMHQISPITNKVDLPKANSTKLKSKNKNYIKEWIIYFTVKVSSLILLVIFIIGGLFIGIRVIDFFYSDLYVQTEQYNNQKKINFNLRLRPPGNTAKQKGVSLLVYLLIIHCYYGPERINAECPHCKTALTAKKKLINEERTCPKCHKNFIIKNDSYNF